MTTSTTLSGRNLPPRPPLKGSFPLDHLGECAPLAKLYSACLREADGAAAGCRALARRYLECRMDKGLMAREGMDALGLDAEVPQQPQEQQEKAEDSARGEERKGFVAGMRTAKRRTQRASGGGGSGGGSGGRGDPGSGSGKAGGGGGEAGGGSGEGGGSSGQAGGGDGET